MQNQFENQIEKSWKNGLISNPTKGCPKHTKSYEIQTGFGRLQKWKIRGTKKITKTFLNIWENGLVWCLNEKGPKQSKELRNPCSVVRDSISDPWGKLKNWQNWMYSTQALIYIYMCVQQQSNWWFLIWLGFTAKGVHIQANRRPGNSGPSRLFKERQTGDFH